MGTEKVGVNRSPPLMVFLPLLWKRLFWLRTDLLFLYCTRLIILNAYFIWFYGLTAYSISTCVNMWRLQQTLFRPNSSNTVPSGVFSIVSFVKYTTFSTDAPLANLILRTSLWKNRYLSARTSPHVKHLIGMIILYNGGRYIFTFFSAMIFNFLQGWWKIDS